MYYAVNGSPETPIPDVNEETPVFRNIYISNVLCRGAGRAVYFNGLPEMPLKNILIKNMTVTNAKKGIVINQASQVNMENIKVEDSEIPAIQIENATGVIINGKEYKRILERCYFPEISGTNRFGTVTNLLEISDKYVFC